MQQSYGAKLVKKYSYVKKMNYFTTFKKSILSNIQFLGKKLEKINVSLFEVDPSYFKLDQS